MISALGLIGGLALLIYMTIKGVNILIAGPMAAIIVALTSGISLIPPLAVEGAPDFAIPTKYKIHSLNDINKI